MRQEDERALGVFERKVLRTIYGGVLTAENVWRRRMNHELHALLGEPTIATQAEIGICNLGDWRAAAQYRATWNNLLGTARVSHMVLYKVNLICRIRQLKFAEITSKYL